MELAELVGEFVRDEPSLYVVVLTVVCSVSKTWANIDGRRILGTIVNVRLKPR